MDIGVAIEVMLQALKLINTEVGDPIKKQALSLKQDWATEISKPYDQIDDARLDSIRSEFLRLVSVYGAAVEGQVAKT